MPVQLASYSALRLERHWTKIYASYFGPAPFDELLLLAQNRFKRFWKSFRFHLKNNSIFFPLTFPSFLYRSYFYFKYKLLNEIWFDFFFIWLIFFFLRSNRISRIYLDYCEDYNILDYSCSCWRIWRIYMMIDTQKDWNFWNN